MYLFRFFTMSNLVALISKDHNLAREKEKTTGDTSLFTKMIGKIEDKLEDRTRQRIEACITGFSRSPYRWTRQNLLGKHHSSALKKLREKKATAKSSKNKKMISSVLIKVSQRKSYADVLGKLRKEVNPDALGYRVENWLQILGLFYANHPV